MDKDVATLNAKLDKLMEMQELILRKLDQGVIISKVESVEPFKKRTKKEQQNQSIEKFKTEFHLQMQYGGQFQRQFHLLNVPSAARINEFLRTNDKSAFDGLKRNS